VSVSGSHQERFIVTYVTGRGSFWLSDARAPENESDLTEGFGGRPELVLVISLFDQDSVRGLPSRVDI